MGYKYLHVIKSSQPLSCPQQHLNSSFALISESSQAPGQQLMQGNFVRQASHVTISSSSEHTQLETSQSHHTHFCILAATKIWVPTSPPWDHTQRTELEAQLLRTSLMVSCQHRALPSHGLKQLLDVLLSLSTQNSWACVFCTLHEKGCTRAMICHKQCALEAVFTCQNKANHHTW